MAPGGTTSAEGGWVTASPRLFPACTSRQRAILQAAWTSGASDHFPRFFSRQYLRARLRRYGLAGSSAPGQNGKSRVAAPPDHHPSRPIGLRPGFKWPKWRMIRTGRVAGISSGESVGVDSLVTMSRL